ncbi:hypothetical protein D9623_33860 (plasmid) [Azospirillum brasilense]|uniref:Uncharacterized protein n=1 Tax=Azospirillum brasilense TaxID=192 RepID=Q6QW35_AZOBR|nr:MULTISPECIES: hypothetical protein [Azospirillum]YP_001686929.1 hypothetical protein APCd_gp88 [Azospirillum phage Cd]AAS83030.1 hypothetical protein pRhico068 [Azospirillum brasilense]MDW7555429.1 hypothetical protein [Azospirillum brasilense]MDW7595163.1 hypothetical protein [Azospirillum brasilense]MDW7630316.1 hypothetical protein [Azospirillum brasilense]MDX5949684.1 hypothetical protein [Azospirillum brasilense]
MDKEIDTAIDAATKATGLWFQATYSNRPIGPAGLWTVHAYAKTFGDGELVGYGSKQHCLAALDSFVATRSIPFTIAAE